MIPLLNRLRNLVLQKRLILLLISAVMTRHIKLLSLLRLPLILQLHNACLIIKVLRTWNFEDIYNADELGYIIKLLAVAKLDPDNTVEVRVNPTLVPKDNQLAFVRNEFNAVMIESEFLGNSMYFGRGAGSRPTATAVVGDVINIAKSLNNPDGYLTYSQFNNYPVKKIGEIESRYYVRFNVIDKPGVLSKISGVFGNYQISIASVIQKERSKTDYVPLIMTTHAALEKNINQALDEIEKMDFNKNEV